ncbi:MAG: NAD-dependent epimerase/dehydratase family protein [candidate division KSB1 bacterium]|nr:NAD-dependent epimerase/dehydratase family protein [candidate division KSB1 bacterium]MDZ7305008.1 NAD-dependent epimerase/dehydratase family protein [candidate division KSB1 bacterium]MDZ7314147.1 NAD-dependent epimerase/dehydratase family protein [candidate division KSB1 bacterium]
MRTLVTGATGFIGSLLVNHLVSESQNQKDDDLQIFCLVRRTSSLVWLKGLSVDFVHGDLFADEALSAVLPEVTHLFHLAGVTKARTPEEYFRANGEATRHLLQLCVRHAKKLQRFVYVSSQAAAGPSPDGHLLTEDEQPKPVSIYGQSKLAGEVACQEFKQELPITIIRPSAVYGPREKDIYQYFKQVKLGLRLRLGGHERKVSIIHVDDLVNGIFTASQHQRAIGETYFMANPQPSDWQELGQAIAGVMRRKTIPITVPEWAAPALAAVSEFGAKITGKPALLNFDKVNEMRQYYWVCSSEKARLQLGFVPRLSIQEGLLNTWQWYRENGWL